MPISAKEIRGWFDGSAAGFRDTIVHTQSRGTAALQAYNPNYAAGDIITGPFKATKEPSFNASYTNAVRPKAIPSPFNARLIARLESGKRGP